MTWREERDALIAQTMAFVQSVTGKPADFAQFPLASAPSKPASSDPASPGSATPEPVPSESVSAPAAPLTAVAAVMTPNDQAILVEAASAGPTAMPPGQVDGKPISVAASSNLSPSAPAATTPASPTTTGSAPVTQPVMGAGPAAEARSIRPDAATVTSLGANVSSEKDQPAAPQFGSITSQLGLQRDMQTEIKARVASFRAHQERFNRERQEYFSTTLAKLRESMDDLSRTEK